MGADLFGFMLATVLVTMVLGRETLSVDNYGGFAPNSVTNAYCRNWNCIFNYRDFLLLKFQIKTEDTTAKVQKALNMGNW